MKLEDLELTYEDKAYQRRELKSWEERKRVEGIDEARILIDKFADDGHVQDFACLLDDFTDTEEGGCPVSLAYVAHKWDKESPSAVDLMKEFLMYGMVHKSGEEVHITALGRTVIGALSPDAYRSVPE